MRKNILHKIDLILSTNYLLIMKRRQLFMPLVVCGTLAMGFTGCVDDNESASVTNIRDAKAAQLTALGEAAKITAEAAKITAEAELAFKQAQAEQVKVQAILFQAEAALVQAEAALVQAQADHQKEQTEQSKAAAEAAKKAAELANAAAELANAAAELANEKLASELEVIKAQAEAAIALAKKEAAKYEQQILEDANDHIAALYRDYTDHTNNIGLKNSTLVESMSALVSLETGLVSAEAQAASEIFEKNQEIKEIEAKIKVLEEDETLASFDVNALKVKQAELEEKLEAAKAVLANNEGVAFQASFDALTKFNQYGSYQIDFEFDTKSIEALNEVTPPDYPVVNYGITEYVYVYGPYYANASTNVSMEPAVNEQSKINSIRTLAGNIESTSKTLGVTGDDIVDQTAHGKLADAKAKLDPAKVILVAAKAKLATATKENETAQRAQIAAEKAMSDASEVMNDAFLKLETANNMPATTPAEIAAKAKAIELATAVHTAAQAAYTVASNKYETATEAAYKANQAYSIAFQEESSAKEDLEQIENNIISKTTELNEAQKAYDAAVKASEEFNSALEKLDLAAYNKSVDAFFALVKENETAEEKYDDASEEVNALTAEINVLSTLISNNVDVEGAKLGYKHDIAKLQSEIHALETTANNQEAAIASKKAEIEALKLKIATLTVLANNAKATLDAAIAAQ